MITQQASKKGVYLDDNFIKEKGWNKVTSPIVHDNLGVIPFLSSGRVVKQLNGNSTLQEEWEGYGMDFETSQKNYYDDSYMTCTNPISCVNGNNVKGADGDGERTKVGNILIADEGTDFKVEDTYQAWLSRNYDLDIEISHDGL